MKIGIGEWGYRLLPMEEHLRLTRSFGVHTMEIGIGVGFAGRIAPDTDAAGAAALRRLFEAYEMETPFVCLENDFTKGDVAADLARVLREMELCAALGARQVRLFTGFRPLSAMTREAFAALADALCKAGALAEQRGMRIALETHGALTPIGNGFLHEPTVSTSPEELQALLRKVPACVGVNFDPGNLKALDERLPVQMLRAVRDRITYVHLKDWLPLPGGGWIAAGVGDGNIDWKSLLDELAFPGVHLIEYEPTHDVADGIGRSIAHVKKLWPDAALA